jgi:hypothetical protein
VFVSPDGTIPDSGPEIYTNINANPNDYIYIVAWSDDGVYQGAVAKFVDTVTGTTVTTSPNSSGLASSNSLWPWQVFATGTNWTINCDMGRAEQHGPPLTGYPYAISNQIVIANASDGGPGSSVGWVGNNGWIGSPSVAPIGSLAHGRLDFSGQYNGNIYPLTVPACIGSSGALMMEYNPEPTNSSCNPFEWGSCSDYSTIPNFLREYLIYRIGPLSAIPGLLSTNICTNGCLTIVNPNDMVITSCVPIQVSYSPMVTDNCCSNGTVTVVCNPTNGSFFDPGTTNVVTCYATDSCGNSNSCSFTVTVVECCTNTCAFTTSVNGASGPWNVTLNPNFLYGVSGNINLPPTVVNSSSGLAFLPGDSLTITSLTPGQDTLSPGIGLSCDANGEISMGASTVGGPGAYISGTVYLEELVGTFAQNGVIVGTPFAIGNGPTMVTIPCGANQLLMGVVDGWYHDNSGSVEVSITGLCSNSCNGCVFCLTCPNDMVVTTCSNSLPVSFPVWVSDTCCSNYTLVTVPPSGSSFPLGTNTVTSTLTDNCGNSNSCSFTVTVLPGANCATNCLPDTNGVKYLQDPGLTNGIVVNATASPWDPMDGFAWILADDFPCTNSGPITDIHLWGSWLNDQVDENAIYTLAIWSDVPTNGPDAYSHPGQLLWTQTYSNGQYTRCPYANQFENFYDGDSYINDGSPSWLGSSIILYYLCFDVSPTNVFIQTGTSSAPTNYWLSVTMQSANSSLYFGWKSSATAYNDAAVAAYNFNPGNFYPQPGDWMPMADMNGTPINLAFKITTATNCALAVTCPGSIVTNSCSPVQVFYPPPTVADPCCGTNWSIGYSPTNGSYFEPGTTTNVQCVAWDDCGNSTSCSFKVTVQCATNLVILHWAMTNGNLILNPPTNLPLLTNFNGELSTDLFHWTIITGTFPIIINIPSNINQGIPYQFYRLISTNGP